MSDRSEAREASGTAGEKLRIDKWLWHARFFRSRGSAGELAGSGAVRVNGERIGKAAHAVRPGDVLTFPQGRLIRVIRVLELGHRRGPAAEAQALYDDLDPPASRPPADSPPHAPDTGRPTGRERRKLDRLRGRDS